MSLEWNDKMPWEDKKSPVFKEWILGNASKNPQDWDINFRRYIDILLVQRKKESNQERTDQRVFQSYLKRLGLEEGALRDKTILDLGCLDGAFVRTCLDRGLTRKVYGMDKELRGEARDEEYDDYFYEADFQKGLPIRDTDLILFKGSFHMLFQDKDSVDRAVKVLLLALNALSSLGEIRIGPITKSLVGGYEDNQKEINNVLEILVKTKNIKYEIIPIDIAALEKNNSSDVDRTTVVLDSVLIIKNNTDKQ